MGNENTSRIVQAPGMKTNQSVCKAAGGRAGRPPGAWAVKRQTLHGGPVRLRAISATPCVSYRNFSFLELDDPDRSRQHDSLVQL